MRKITVLFTLVLALSVNAQTKPAVPVVKMTPTELAKFNQDKEAIKAMAGIYKVTFEFGETFSPDTSYKYHDRKFDEGIEYVTIVEESDKKIVLQHLLIVSDSMIVKHWRQDWIFEATAVLSFYKDNEWIQEKIPAERVKGTWTQKVYQVDDSPRYEGYGTWIHADGRHYWESVADAPLPRREFTKRSDYNVLKRHSHVEITATGWTFEQDNEKILRKDGVDQLLCWEKGIEKFTKGAYTAKPAVDYWNKTEKYWADVRKVWDEVYKTNASGLTLSKKVNDQMLFEALFDLADANADVSKYVSADATAKIRSTIDSFVVKK